MSIFPLNTRVCEGGGKATTRLNNNYITTPKGGRVITFDHFLFITTEVTVSRSITLF